MLNDLRDGFRNLLATPGQSAIAILALALAIGANTAIFSVTQAVLLRPLPFTNPGRIAALWETHPLLGKQEVAWPDYQDWRSQTRSFSEMAAFTMNGHVKLALSGGGQQPEQVKATLATHTLFPMLGIQPMLGQTFSSDDPAHDRHIVLSHALWQRRFGADPAIIGKPVLLNGDAFQVIAVLPPRVQAPEWADIWLSISRLQPLARQQRQWHSLHVLARLRDDVSFEQADADLQTVVRRLQRDYPVTNKPTGGMLVPLDAEYLGNVRVALLLLVAAVGLVLFIACINVAHLTLSRSVARQREMAVRAALGATQWRLIRQLLTESFMMSLLAGVAGLGLAAASAQVLRRAASEVLPRAEDVHLDGATLLVAICFSVFAAIVAGLVPAVRASRTGLTHALKEGERSHSGVKARRLHALLVATEVALTVIVLVTAGLLAESFRRVITIEPEFQMQELLHVRISLVPSRWPSAANVRQFYEQLLVDVKSLPGVTAAAMVDTPPLSKSGSRFAVHGLPEPAAGQFPVAQVRLVTPEYFATMGIPLIEGRNFKHSDIDTSRVIINRALQRKFMTPDHATGQQLVMGLFAKRRYQLPIIGVAGDIHELGLELPAEPTIYFCDYRATSTLLVRTDAAPASLIEPVRRAVLHIDAEQPIYDAQPVEALFARTLARRRFLVGLFALFGALALTLAIIGIFGVVARAVTERMREVAVRVALGATPRDVVLLILRQQLVPVIAGLAAGSMLAALISSTVHTLWFDIGTFDPGTYAAANVLVLLVAGVVTWTAAVRVLRIDPAAAMRHVQ